LCTALAAAVSTQDKGVTMAILNIAETNGENTRSIITEALYQKYILKIPKN
jgi:hypothetical protein